MKIMDAVPEEIIQLIESFIFGKCNCCRKVCHFTKLHYNLSYIRYITIFDDDYGMEERKNFEVICFSCVHFYNESKWWTMTR